MLDGKNLMGNIKRSTMLALFLAATFTSFSAKADYPDCKDKSDTLERGQICYDEEHRLARFVKVTIRHGFLGTGIGSREKVRVVSEKLSTKEIALLNGGGGSGNGNRNGSPCISPANPCNGRNGPVADNSNNDSSPRNRDTSPSTRARDRNPSRDDDSDSGSSRSRSRPTADTAATKYDALYNFCLDFDTDGTKNSIGDRADLVSNTQKEIDDKQKDLDKAKAAEVAARDKLYTGCRNECTAAAMGSTSCKMSAAELESVLTRAEALSNESVVAYLRAGDPNYDQPGKFKDSVDPSKACEKLYLKKDCRDSALKDAIAGCSIKNDDGSYFTSADWKAAYDKLAALQKEMNDLNAKIAAAKAKHSKKECTVASARDVNKSIWETADSDCLQVGKDSCDAALKNARLDLDDEVKLANQQCTYCTKGQNQGGQGGNDGSGSCSGNGNSGCRRDGSNTAAWLMAGSNLLSNVGGAAFQYFGAKSALNACANNYNTYMAGYNTYQATSNLTGIQPSAPFTANCGAGGGMGGFYGGIGTSGNYGNYGSSGYPGFGVSAGIYGGSGTGGIYGSSGYPSAFPAPGGVYGGTTGGIYGGTGYGSSGYPTAFPAPGGVAGAYGNTYGSPLSSLYGGAMMQGSSNIMGVQQQMYNAQAQLQQMQMQNSVLGQASYSPYGASGYAGMGYPSYLGNYSAGLSGYNPYSSGLSLSAGVNLSTGGGYNTYNPYQSPYSSYYPGITGASYYNGGNSYYPQSYQAPSVYNPYGSTCPAGAICN